MVASAIAPLVTFGLTKAFGPKSKPTQPLQSFKPVNFNAGGLSSSFNNNRFSLSSSPERTGLVRGLSCQFAGLGKELGGLRDLVKPGVGSLTQARLGEIEAGRSRTVGNLRESLGRRRVLGSSFGQSTLAAAEAEFDQLRAEQQAEGFLQELELTVGLIEGEFAAATQGFQVLLDELNVQADIGAKLTSQATTVMADNAKFLSESLAKEAEGAGQFFGQTFRPLFNSIAETLSGVKTAQSAFTQTAGGTPSISTG